MKKLILIIFIAITAGCSKNDAIDPQYKNILGEWTYVKIIHKDFKNGVLIKSDVHEGDSTIISEYGNNGDLIKTTKQPYTPGWNIVFEKNGKAHYMVNGQPGIPFKYTVKDSILSFIVENDKGYDPAYPEISTSIFFLKSLTESRMIFFGENTDGAIKHVSEITMVKVK